jgi:5-methylcytosine-specific restriction endonuclease McrA
VRASRIPAAQAKTCGNCGVEYTGPSRRGRCKNCASWIEKHRTERPKSVYARPAPKCINCGKEGWRDGLDRCSRCLSFLKRHGVDRPAQLPRDILQATGTRTCTNCRETKPLGEFYRNQWVCTACGIIRLRAWRARYALEHAEEIRQKGIINHRLRRVAKVEPAVVFERDGWRCGVCGNPVDPSLKWPNLMAATMDHVVPISKGGPHSYENCQLAHSLCNIRKGDSVPACAG